MGTAAVYRKSLTASAVLVATLLFSISFYVYSSAFIYRWVSGYTSITNIKLVDIASNPYPLCIGISRTSRSALYFTDFETLPSGWYQYGGQVEINPNGYRGSALSIADNDQGNVADNVLYIYGYDLRSYTEFWVSAKMRNTTAMFAMNIAFFDNAASPPRNIWTVPIFASSGGYAGINPGTVSVYYWNQSSGWQRIAGPVSITNYNPANWYTVVVRYSRSGNRNLFDVYVYDPNGVLVASIINAQQTSRSRPRYVGFAVDDGRLDVISTALFDDFIVSTADPRRIMFENLPGAGYTVEVMDSLGNLVNSTRTTGTTALLGIVTDIVVGTGLNGKLRVRYPNNMLCLVTSIPTSDATVGGDTYRVTWGPPTVDTASRTVAAYIGYGGNRTVGPLFNISVYPGDTRYTYIELDTASSSIPSTLNLNISIISALGAQSSKVLIVNGVVQSSSTSAVALQGSNNYVLIEGFFTSRGWQATLNLNIVACSTPNLSICVITPVTVYLSTV
uniref:DUF2341 domain-containing protein n=1 Tax=Ignisphaera aggregans TaxID=334771 RepID=A0A7C4FI52_9CREN